MRKMVQYNIAQFITLFLGATILRIANIILLHVYQTPGFIDITRGFFYDVALTIFIILVSDLIIFLFSLTGCLACSI